MITVLAVVCGVLFAVSLGIWKRVTQDTVEWYEDPFTYFALACVAVGAPLLLLVRALAGLVYERTINMFLTTLLAVAGACTCACACTGACARARAHYPDEWQARVCKYMHVHMCR